MLTEVSDELQFIVEEILPNVEAEAPREEIMGYMYPKRHKNVFFRQRLSDSCQFDPSTSNY